MFSSYTTWHGEICLASVAHRMPRGQTWTTSRDHGGRKAHQLTATWCETCALMHCFIVAMTSFQDLIWRLVPKDNNMLSGNEALNSMHQNRLHLEWAFITLFLAFLRVFTSCYSNPNRWFWYYTWIMLGWWGVPNKVLSSQWLERSSQDSKSWKVTEKIIFNSRSTFQSSQLKQIIITLVRMPESDFVALLHPWANAENCLTIMHPKVVLWVVWCGRFGKSTAFSFL